MTLIELVDRGAVQLQTALKNNLLSLGHGTNSAFDEAAWLTLWQLKYPLDLLDEVANEAVNEAQITAVETLIAKRITSRLPAAYLTQEAWLQGVPFYVDERVIVPRSLIAECIADATIDAWLDEGTQRILDLCTGNGSLAILAALAWPEVVVDASDISADALAVATINVKRHELQSRITLLQSDGLAAICGCYDLILCNPPYVNSASMAALPREYRAEPNLALAGGADGMDFIRPLIARVAEHLTEHGVLVLEIGFERGYFESAFPLLETVWLPTSQGDDMVLLLTRDAILAAQN